MITNNTTIVLNIQQITYSVHTTNAILCMLIFK